MRNTSNSHIIYDFSEKVSTTVNLTTKTINTLLEEIPRTTYVKIDTERAKIDKMRNTQNLFSDKNLRFICETLSFLLGSPLM